MWKYWTIIFSPVSLNIKYIKFLVYFFVKLKVPKSQFLNSESKIPNINQSIGDITLVQLQFKTILIREGYLIM